MVAALELSRVQQHLRDRQLADERVELLHVACSTASQGQTVHDFPEPGRRGSWAGQTLLPGLRGKQGDCSTASGVNPSCVPSKEHLRRLLPAEPDLALHVPCSAERTA